ncbi:hypothetical protein MAR_015422 [Mya arenaria]|uniref:Uncharacterized protein n=1 Tax=Mya arenaria TaxID=6604 RepID=A0ABY7FGZ8_MYAAR|nr:hypothetical protein MAR_015422 [Mya arenaria]
MFVMGIKTNDMETLSADYFQQSSSRSREASPCRSPRTYSHRRFNHNMSDSYEIKQPIANIGPQAYVVLHDGCLYYFKDEKARKASGRFSLYGYNAKNLQPVGKDAEKDELIDDPGFYQTVEQNIYDDSKKFVPSQDYQKKCSIKKENEDSDDEDLQMPDPAIFVDRPPVPLPHDNDPFLTLKTPSMPRTPLAMGEPPALPSGPPPHKPPRTTDLFPPHVPPHRNPPALPRDDPPPRPDFSYIIGCLMGYIIGCLMGYIIGCLMGYIIGCLMGYIIGCLIGYIIGCLMGYIIGCLMGYIIGCLMGYIIGCLMGYIIGCLIGYIIGCLIGYIIGCLMGYIIGCLMGYIIGCLIGYIIGCLIATNNKAQKPKVLVVFAENQCKKYRIKQQSGKYYLAEAGHHDMRVNSLLKFYQRNTLPTVNAKLRIPYRRHPRYMD